MKRVCRLTGDDTTVVDSYTTAMTGGDKTDGVPLTQTERELLGRALREGYFETPRRVSLVTLAEEVGLSDREAMEALHHAIAKILTRTEEFRADESSGQMEDFSQGPSP